MTIKTDAVLTGLKIISWIIFLALCIETGALLFNFIYSLFRPVATNNLYQGLDLSALYQQSSVQYGFLFSLIITVSALKAYVFFLVIQLFTKLNLATPFNHEVQQQITSICWVVLGTGLVGMMAHHFTKHSLHKGYEVEAVFPFWNGTQAYLLMAAVLFVIAQIFQKGIDLQQENDLTV